MSAWIREAIVSYVSSFISEYIENFSKSQLRVALWNGSIDFDDLILNLDSLNSLEYPFEIQQATIGKLTIKVPWTKFGREPIEIHIDRLDVQFHARNDFDFKQSQALKQKMITERIQWYFESNPSLQTQTSWSQLASKISGSFVSKMLDTIQLRMSNFKAQYVDYSGSNIILHSDEISAMSSLDHTQSYVKTIEKTIQLQRLSLSISENESTKVILQPFSLETTLRFCPDGATHHVPLYTTKVAVGPVSFNICDRSFLQIVKIYENWEDYFSKARCARFQTSTQSSQSVVDRGRAAYYRIRLMLRRSKHPIDRAFCMDEYKYLFSQIFNSDNTESISREICQLDLHEYVRLYHSENSDAYEDAVIQRIIELEMYLEADDIALARVKATRMRSDLLEQQESTWSDWLSYISTWKSSESEEDENKPPPSPRSARRWREAQKRLRALGKENVAAMINVSLESFDLCVQFGAKHLTVRVKNFQCEFDAQGGLEIWNLKIRALDCSAHLRSNITDEGAGEFSIQPSNETSALELSVEQKNVTERLIRMDICPLDVFYDLKAMESVILNFPTASGIPRIRKRNRVVGLRSEQINVDIQGHGLFLRAAIHPDLVPKGGASRQNFELAVLLDHLSYKSSYKTGQDMQIHLDMKHLSVRMMQICTSSYYDYHMFEILSPTNLKYNLRQGSLQNEHQLVIPKLTLAMNAISASMINSLMNHSQKLIPSGSPCGFSMFSIELSMVKLSLSDTTGVDNCTSHNSIVSEIDKPYQRSFVVCNIPLETYFEIGISKFILTDFKQYESDQFQFTVESIVLVKGNQNENPIIKIAPHIETDLMDDSAPRSKEDYFGISATMNARKGNLEAINCTFGDVMMSINPEEIQNDIMSPLNDLRGDESSTVATTPSIDVKCDMINAIFAYEGQDFFLISVFDVVYSRDLEKDFVLSIFNIRVRDLTPEGYKNSRIITGVECSCDHRPCHVISIQHNHISIHGIELVLVWRFFLELTAYYNQVWGPSPSSSESESTVPWTVSIVNLSLLVPRNSRSTDSLAFIVSHVSYETESVSESWNLPHSKETDSDSDGAEFMDAVDEDDSESDSHSFVDAKEFFDDGEAACVSRTKVKFSQTELFVRLGSKIKPRTWSYEHGSHSNNVPSPRRHSGIKASRRKIPSFARRDNSSWRRISKGTIDTISILYDMESRLNRCLITLERPGLQLELTQEAYELILGCWYDNLEEYAQFPTPQAFPPWEPSESRVWPSPQDLRDDFNTRAEIAFAKHNWEVGLAFSTLEVTIDGPKNCIRLEDFVFLATGGQDITCIYIGSTSGVVLDENKEEIVKPVKNKGGMMVDAVEKSLQSSFIVGKTDSDLKIQFSMALLPNDYSCMNLVIQHHLFEFESTSQLNRFVDFFSRCFYDPIYGMPWALENTISDARKSIDVSFQGLRLDLTDDRRVSITFSQDKETSWWYVWDAETSAMEVFIPSVRVQDERENRTIIPSAGGLLVSSYSMTANEYNGKLRIDTEGRTEDTKQVSDPTVIYLTQNDIDWVQGLLKADCSEAEVLSQWAFESESFEIVFLDAKHGFQKPICRLSARDFRLEYVVDVEERHEEITGIVGTTTEIDFCTFIGTNATIRLDHFNVALRAFEPALEPCQCQFYYENGSNRGRGILFNSDSPLQLNLNAEMVDTLVDLFVGNDKSELPPYLMQNCTGDALRYYTGDKKGISGTVATLMSDSESSELHFAPLFTVVHGNEIIQNSFENHIELERILSHNQCQPHVHSKEGKMNEISIQLKGFKWLHSVPIMYFGARYYSLALEIDPESLETSNSRLKSAMQCAVLISKTRIGRKIALQSVFEIQNDTAKPVEIVCAENVAVSSVNEASFAVIPPKSSYHVPLRIIYQAIIQSSGETAGCLFLRPVEKGNSAKYHFSAPLDLLKLMSLTHASITCSSTKTPDECSFCIQIKHDEAEEAVEPATRRGSLTKGKRLRGFRERRHSTDDSGSINQLHRLILTPPLSLFNGLPTTLVFSILTSHGVVLSSGLIESGESVMIHQVQAQHKLFLTIQIPAVRCESSKPSPIRSSDETEGETKTSSIAMIQKDKHQSQNLILQLEQQTGSGGQRMAALYCPYWIVNLTELDLHFKQENRMREISSSTYCSHQHPTCAAEIVEKNLLANLPPGVGSLNVPHTTSNCMCMKPECVSRRIIEYTTMFSFASFLMHDTLASSDSICIRTTESNWSKPFSVDTIGVDQSLHFKHLDSSIELGIEVTVGGGGFYRTKIVRICPRYVVYNQIDRVLKIQHRDDVLCALKPGQMSAMSSNSSFVTDGIRISYAETERWDWSGEVYLHDLGEAVLKIAKGITPDRQSSRGIDMVSANIQLGLPVVFMTLKRITDHFDSLYRITNNLLTTMVLYRQAGSKGTSWEVVGPGESANYAWDEPSQPHQVCVRLCGINQRYRPNNPIHIHLGDRRRSSTKRDGSTNFEEVEIPFDKIGASVDMGYQTGLGASKATVKVDTDGHSRILFVSASKELSKEMLHCDAEMTKISENLHLLEDLRQRLTDREYVDTEMLRSEVKSLISRSFISERGQVMVRILQAVNLKPTNGHLYSNPFCTVSFYSGRKGTINPLQFFQRNTQLQATYFVENTLNPTWLQQEFIISMKDAGPLDKIKINVRSYEGIGTSSLLGRVFIDPREISQSEAVDQWLTLSGNSTGSLRIQAQTIPDEDSLIQHWLQVLEDEISMLESAHTRGIERMEVLREQVKKQSANPVHERTTRRQHLRIKHGAAKLKTEAATKLRSAVHIASNFKNKLGTAKGKLHHRIDESRKAGLKRMGASRVHFNTNARGRQDVAAGRMERRAAAADFLEKSLKSEDMLQLPKLNIRSRLDFASEQQQRMRQAVKKKIKKTHQGVEANIRNTLDSASQAVARLGSLPREVLRGRDTTQLSTPLEPDAIRRISDDIQSDQTSESQFSVNSIVDQIRRQHRQVTTSGGELTVKIIQARHIEDLDRSTFCVIKCQRETHKTASSKTLMWENATALINVSHANGDLVLQITSVSGGGRVRVEGEAQIRLQQLCDATIPGQSFVVWFRLHLPHEFHPTGDAIHSLIGEQTTGMYSDEPMGQPCIQLAIDWKPNLLEDKDIRSYTSVTFSDISLSLIDTVELVRLSLTSVDLRHIDAVERQRFALQVEGIQIDNQLSTMHGSSVYLSQPLQHSCYPVLQFFLIRNNSRSSEDLNYLEYVSILIQELDISLEEKSLRTTHGVLMKWIDKIQSAGNQTPETPSSDRKIYIDHLGITPLKLNMSFQRASGEASRETIRGYAEVASTFTAVLIRIFTTVENAPLALNALELRHVFQNISQLQDRVIQHYMSRALRQLYRLLGSMNLVGNPIGLVGNLGNGVRDFFFEPYRGIALGPAAFTKGVAKGTVSLFGNTAYGILDTASRFTLSMGDGIAPLCGDELYLAKRTRNLHSKVDEQNQRAVLKRGMQQIQVSVSDGILGGLAGIVMEPIRGAQKEGTIGFAKGLGYGVAGAVVKPTTGALDCATHMVQGARDMAGTMVVRRKTRTFRDRKSLSRALGPDGRILCLADDQLWGRMILSHFDLLDHKTSRLLSTVGFLRSSGTVNVVVVSTTHVVYVKLKHISSPELKWFCLRKDITRCELLRKPSGSLEIVLSYTTESESHEYYIAPCRPKSSYYYEQEQKKVFALYDLLIVAPIESRKKTVMFGFGEGNLLQTQLQYHATYYIGKDERAQLELIPWPVFESTRDFKSLENETLISLQTQQVNQTDDSKQIEASASISKLTHMDSGLSKDTAAAAPSKQPYCNCCLIS